MGDMGGGGWDARLGNKKKWLLMLAGNKQYGDENRLRLYSLDQLDRIMDHAHAVGA